MLLFLNICLLYILKHCKLNVMHVSNRTEKKVELKKKQNTYIFNLFFRFNLLVFLTDLIIHHTCIMHALGFYHCFPLHIAELLSGCTMKVYLLNKQIHLIINQMGG